MHNKQITCSSSFSCATHQNRRHKEERKELSKVEDKDRRRIQYTEGERSTRGGRRQGMPQEEDLMKEW